MLANLADALLRKNINIQVLHVYELLLAERNYIHNDK